MAQAMDLSHPSALRFLYRDVKNVLNFFGNIGCDSLPTAHEIFNEITGLQFNQNEDLYIQVYICFYNY
jgi:serine/threonine-protein kinase RIO1